MRKNIIAFKILVNEVIDKNLEIIENSITSKDVIYFNLNKQSINININAYDCILGILIHLRNEKIYKNIENIDQEILFLGSGLTDQRQNRPYRN